MGRSPSRDPVETSLLLRSHTCAHSHTQPGPELPTTKARFLPLRPLRQAGSLARVSLGAPHREHRPGAGASHPADKAREGPPGGGTRVWQGLSSASACPHLPGRWTNSTSLSTVRELPLGRRPSTFSAAGTISRKTASPGTDRDSSGRNGAWGAVDEASLACHSAARLLMFHGPGVGARLRHTGRPCFLPSGPHGAVPLESFSRRKCE